LRDKWELLNLTLTLTLILTEEINTAYETLRDRARAMARMRVIWHCKLFDTTPASMLCMRCGLAERTEKADANSHRVRSNQLGAHCQRRHNQH